MVKSHENLVAAYAFLTGVILSIILGFTTRSLSSANSYFYIALVVLGAIIGYLNAGDKDSTTFLLASVSLVIVGGLGNSTLVFISNISPVLQILNDILRALLVLFIPATIIAALKVVFSIAKIN
ncbi:MAG: hypothetical protein ACI83O_000826 [Patescibacteria group bacterium]|jgi:hypothetical protein